MHITVSFKDNSSICTCMLIFFLKKNKPEWFSRNMDITTNKTVSQWEWGVQIIYNYRATEQRWLVCVWVCVCSSVSGQRYTRNMALTSKDGTNQRYMFRGTRDMNWCQISVETFCCLCPSDLPTLDTSKYHLSTEEAPLTTQKSCGGWNLNQWLSLSCVFSEEQKLDAGRDAIFNILLQMFLFPANLKRGNKCASVRSTH